MSASGLKIDRFLSVSEAKTRLPDLVRRTGLRNEVVALTRQGVPSAVLVSMDQYEGLIETAKILSDRKAIRSLKRSLKQAAKGQWVSHNEVFFGGGKRS